MAKHAKLPPSASNRWMACTASYEFTKDMPIVESKWAKEGTLAHEALACLMEHGFVHGILMLDEFFTSDMLDYLYLCEDYLKKLKKGSDLFLIEREVTIKPIEGFGSIDYLVYKDQTLHIIDLKYGTSRVKVEDNSQLKLYAYGAYKFLEPIAVINDIKLHIMQPRLNKNGSFTSYTQDIKDLITWTEYTAQVKAQSALTGNGVFKAGDWCWFCPGKLNCTHLISQDFD